MILESHRQLEANISRAQPDKENPPLGERNPTTPTAEPDVGKASQTTNRGINYPLG